MHEDAFERLRLGQTDGPMFLRILQRQQRRAQQGRIREVGVVIWQGAELNHGTMLPQGFRRGQTKKSPGFCVRLFKR